MRNVLVDVFRNEFGEESGSPKREIRQDFGGFWRTPVKQLTAQ
jgi:hypothetical protein